MSLRSPQVRRATPDDAERLAELSLQLDYAATAAEVADRLSLIEHQPGHAVFVVELADHVLGWIHVFSTLRLESAPFAELGGLIVDEGFRRSGVGRRLVETAEQWTREHGLAELRVRTNIVREEARRFYENLGFRHAKSQAVFARRLPTPPTVTGEE